MEVNIRSEIIQISKLAPLPKIVQQIFKVTSDPTSSARDLSLLIIKDQSLTAKILKIINSAYYGFNRKIGNVNHAIVILGFDEIKSITMALCLMKYYPVEQSRLFNRELFWKHSIGTAHIARALSSLKMELNCEDAYVIGLLHDFGKVILDQFFPEVFRNALELAAQHKQPLHHVLKESIGIDHAEIGGLIAEHWQLPVPLSNAIRLHHNPAEADNSDYFVHLVHLANYFCHKNVIGASGNPKPDEPFEGSLKALGIENQDLDQVWDFLNIGAQKIDLFL